MEARPKLLSQFSGQCRHHPGKQTNEFQDMQIDRQTDRQTDRQIAHINFVTEPFFFFFSQEVLPTKEGKGVGVALFKPGNIAIEECDTADKVKSMVKDNFPQFQDVIPEKAFAEFANQRVQRLPIFQYAANSLVGPQTALVGDSIHTVKPYFGLGVNSAFEDIGVLRDSLQTLQTSLGTLDSSLERYSESHKHNAKAMVQMSRTFDQGFLKFVLPSATQCVQ